ncbi:MAG TPA: 1-acyl-sn-glycerol-3-phosphate acyltransferase [Caulobacteraceae bacterium]
MAFESSAPPFLCAHRPRAHIVDALIAERAPKLAATAAWPLLRPMLYGLLDYAKARRMADAIAPLGGRAALDFVAALLSVKVHARGLDRVPARGRLIAVCNHPTGIADGVAVYEALKAARPELMFYANSDAHRVAPRLSEVLIPVEWVEEKRTRERTRLTLSMTRETMEAERALVVFPAGRLARKTPGGGASDPPWASSAFSVARKYEADILPMHLAGPWPALFHFFHDFSTELRDMTLFHELLNKRGKTFFLTIGHPVAPGALPLDAVEAAQAMRGYVERVLPADPDRRFA